MEVKAYILIEAEQGRTDDALRIIRGLPGVREADTVTGPFDLIALVEVEDINALGILVKNRFQSVTGVKRTVTCICIS